MDRTFKEFRNFTPPPAVLLDQASLFAVLRAAGVSSVQAWWEYAPSSEGWDLHRATATIGGLQEVATATNNASLPVGQTAGPGRSSADLVGTIRHATRAETAVNASVGPVVLGTAGVGLLVLIAAARTWLDRRRQEIVILTLRGAGAASVALKAVAELLVPVGLGAAGGMAIAWFVVRELGPSRLLERDAFRSAVVSVGVATAAALVALAAAVFIGARRVTVQDRPAATSHRQFLWEPLALVLAGAAFYELRTRESTVVADVRVDSLLLLFPILLFAGSAGLLSRLALSRRMIGRVAARLPLPGWLAARRLAAGRARAAPVVTGAAVSIGIVLFSGTVSSSLRATVEAKATLPLGSAQVFLLADPVPLPAGSPLTPHATQVIRTTERTVVVRGHAPADVLGVDPATFERAAFWDRTFADRSLESLVGLLRGAGGGDVPAIAVGAGLPDRFTLSSVPARGRDATIPVRVAGRAEAFPGLGGGLQGDRPLVVVDRAALLSRRVDSRSELWVDSESPEVAGDVADAGLPVTTGPILASGRQDQGRLQLQTWSLDYLQAIGIAAGIVTLCGLGLYFAAVAARRRVGTALATRMGVTRRAAATATAAEVGAMLAAGVLFAAVLSWIAVQLVFDYLDPLPRDAPDALLRFDTDGLAASVAGALIATLLTAALVERRAASASLADLVRHAG